MSLAIEIAQATNPNQRIVVSTVPLPTHRPTLITGASQYDETQDEKPFAFAPSSSDVAGKPKPPIQLR